MVFKQPKWVPNVDLETVPDSIPISHFMLDEKYGRTKLRDSRSPFVCGLSGTHYTSLEVKRRVEYLARALAKEFDWSPNKGSEWDKLITIFAHNTVSLEVGKCFKMLVPDTTKYSWTVCRSHGLYTISPGSHRLPTRHTVPQN